MRTVGSDEAATDLASLLAEVARGETIVITQHGVPVAELVPSRNGTKPATGNVVEEWISYRRSHNITLGGLSIREMIDEGRR